MNNLIDYTSRSCQHFCLGDNCCCCDSRHPSGQRIHETWKFDADIAIESFNINAGLWS